MSLLRIKSRTLQRSNSLILRIKMPQVPWLSIEILTFWNLTYFRPLNLISYPYSQTEFSFRVGIKKGPCFCRCYFKANTNGHKRWIQFITRAFQTHRQGWSWVAVGLGVGVWLGVKNQAYRRHWSLGAELSRADGRRRRRRPNAIMCILCYGWLHTFAWLTNKFAIHAWR